MNGTDHADTDAAGVINNGRGRRDRFLHSTMRASRGRALRSTSDDQRRPSRNIDSRPPLTRNLGSSMSVRVNVVDSSVYLFSVNTIAYINLTVVNLALIIAGTIVLVRHWGDEDVCDAAFRSRWRWWALGLVVRKVLITPAHMVRWKLSLQAEEERNPVLDKRSESFVQVLEWIGFIYFVFGHVYLVQSRSCNDPLDSPIYQLSVAIIVLKYMRYCLPCLVICVLGPAAICCLPCVLRVLAILLVQEPAAQGPAAAQEQIESLPTVKYGEMENMEDESCAICMVDYEAEDELRTLPCGHAFHKACTDSWLVVNPSCPICRAPCFDDDDEDNSGGQEHAAEPTPVGDTLA